MAGPLLMILAVLFTALGAAAATAVLRPTGRVDAAVAFAVIASAGLTAALLAAGIAGLLRPGVVLAILGAWALSASLASLRWTSLKKRIRWPAGVRLSRSRVWPALLVVLAAFALAWQVLVALVLPPYAYDALTYHLTTVISWIQQGSLELPGYSGCCDYYPFSPDLLIAFPALFLHSTSLIGLVQVPFVLLGAVATAGLARIAGLSGSAAAASGALFAVTPAVLTQAPTNYVDVMLAAEVLAALYSVTRYAQTGAVQHLIVTGLAGGLVLGTKGLGLLWAVVLCLCAMVAAGIAVRGGHVRAPSAARAFGGAAAIALALGGWWYLRNAVTTGNPLYPFTIRFLGTTVFHGPKEVADTLTAPSAGAHMPWPVSVALSWASDLDFWNQGTYSYQQRLGGLGPTWAWLGIPMLTAMLFSLARRPNAALLPVAAVLGVFVVQPYSWWARFTLPLAALGAVAVAMAATRARWRWVQTAVQMSSFLLALVGVVLSSYAVDPAGRARELPARRILALVGTPPAERTLGRLFYPEYAFLDRVPDDAKIVLDEGDEVRFVSLFFGPRFSRQVLPSDAPCAPRDAWVVTSVGSPLDRTAAATHVLFSDVRGFRAWRPKPVNQTLFRATRRGQ